MNLSNQAPINNNKQENLFNFDIGIFDCYSKLNCFINLHQKSFRYYKCKKTILASFDPYLQLKQWAFKKIYHQSYKIKENADSIFVPLQLYKGNLLVMAAFLKQLRKQKVSSFISLHIIDRNFRQKCLMFQKFIAKFILKIKKYFFRVLYEDYCNKYRKKEELPNPFKFTPTKTKINSLMNTQSRKRHKSLSIQYSLIKVDYQSFQKSKENQIHSLQKTKDKKGKVVSIKMLEQTSTKRIYRFDSLRDSWNKKKLCKIINANQI